MVVVEEEQGAVVVVEAGAAAREERGRIRSRVATSSLVARSELGYRLRCSKTWLLLTCLVYWTVHPAVVATPCALCKSRPSRVKFIHGKASCRYQWSSNQAGLKLEQLGGSSNPAGLKREELWGPVS